MRDHWLTIGGAFWNLEIRWIYWILEEFTQAGRRSCQNLVLEDSKYNSGLCIDWFGTICCIPGVVTPEALRFQVKGKIILTCRSLNQLLPRILNFERIRGPITTSKDIKGLRGTEKINARRTTELPVFTLEDFKCNGGLWYLNRRDFCTIRCIPGFVNQGAFRSLVEGNFLH